MIALCLVATAVSLLLLLIPEPPARSIRVRLAADGPAPQRRRSVTIAVLAVAAGGLITGGGLIVGGVPGAVVGAAAAVALGTAVWLLAQRRSSRAALTRRTEVARGCAAIAAQVRVGRVPGDALATAALDWPVLSHAHQVRLLGGDVPDALLSQAGRPGCTGMADLARAWRLAVETGAPMAGVLDQVALALRRDEARQRTVAAELAGPRATGKVMAVLPFCGIGMGYLLGGRPIEFLLGGPLGWACLLGGVALSCAGVLWVTRLARVAEES